MDQLQPSQHYRQPEIANGVGDLSTPEILQHFIQIHLRAANWSNHALAYIDPEAGSITEMLHNCHDEVHFMLSRLDKNDGIVGV
jgi:hypothetical protein